MVHNIYIKRQRGKQKASSNRQEGKIITFLSNLYICQTVQKSKIQHGHYSMINIAQIILENTGLERDNLNRTDYMNEQ